VNTDKLKRVPQHPNRSASWVTKCRTCVDRVELPASGRHYPFPGNGAEPAAGRLPRFCYLRL
jgi:hypothetical protein